MCRTLVPGQHNLLVALAKAPIPTNHSLWNDSCHKLIHMSFFGHSSQGTKPMEVGNERYTLPGELGGESTISAGCATGSQVSWHWIFARNLKKRTWRSEWIWQKEDMRWDKVWMVVGIGRNSCSDFAFIMIDVDFLVFYIHKPIVNYATSMYLVDRLLRVPTNAKRTATTPTVTWPYEASCGNFVHHLLVSWPTLEYIIILIYISWDKQRFVSIQRQMKLFSLFRHTRSNNYT